MQLVSHFPTIMINGKTAQFLPVMSRVTSLLLETCQKKLECGSFNWRAASVNTRFFSIKSELVSVKSGFLMNFEGQVKTGGGEF
jgi:hypothetical protein